MTGQLVVNFSTTIFNRELNGATYLYIGEASTLRGDAQDGRLRLYSENAGVIKWVDISNSGTNLQISAESGFSGGIQCFINFDILGGKLLRVRDSTNADWGQWTHDGTDLNLTLTNTTAYNITGAVLNLDRSVGLSLSNVSTLTADGTYTFLRTTDGSVRLWLGQTAAYINGDNIYFRDSSSDHQFIMTNARFGPYDENNLYDLANSTYRFKDLWMAGNVNLNDGGSVIQTPNSAGGSIWTPGGANWYSNASSKTGAITIKVPGDALADMLSFSITVYEYVTNKSFTVQISGYAYQTGTANPWNNVSAYIIQSPNSAENYTVRFGHDGTDHLVYIGELADTWSYPQVQVFNFMSGYTTTIANYDDGWDVYWEATAFENLDETHANITVGAFRDPMTTHGDIMWYNGGVARLARGSDNQVLTMNGTSLNWETPSAGGISNTVSTSAPTGGADDGDIWCRV